MDVSSFLRLKVLLNHTIPFLKVQKISVDSLKTVGTKRIVVTKIDLVNNRSNAAAITATNIPNKRKLNIGGLSYIS